MCVRCWSDRLVSHELGTWRPPTLGEGPPAVKRQHHGHGADGMREVAVTARRGWGGMWGDRCGTVRILN
jgi:hypothetical protein